MGDLSCLFRDSSYLNATHGVRCNVTNRKLLCLRLGYDVHEIVAAEENIFTAILVNRESMIKESQLGAFFFVIGHIVQLP